MPSVGFLPRRTALGMLAFSLLTLAAGGCGKSSGTVSGKVSYQGKPLPGGYVNFMSESAKGDMKISPIKEDGSYSVSGLPVGSVKISVQGLAKRRLADLPGQGGKDEKSQQKEVYVPPQYGNTETSGLTYDVKPGPQPHDIDLK
ncbi:MAG: hypothetical protein ACRELF_05725 [Gemmataceae bacterium]